MAESDQAPPNYNANESMLSGGIDTPIMKVMGGGGVGGGDGTAPNGYNETQSLLSGGIDVPIMKVEGGGPQEEALERARKESAKKQQAQEETEEEKKIESQENIRIIKSYKNADPDEYNNFIGGLHAGTKLDSVIAKLEKEITQPRKLHYMKSGNKIEIASINNDSNYEKVKIIPFNTKQVIVLPPIKNSDEFFNMILFLKQNGFLTIQNTEFKLKRKCFVIHCSIDLNNKINNYFYLKLKKLNNNYEIMNNPYKIIYPKETDGSKGLLFSSIPLLKPDGLNDLEPTSFETIKEYDINNMYYKKSDDNKTYDKEFSQIQGGDSDTENPTGYNLTLKNNIIILDLVDEDVATVNVDINGILYRIRVPILKNNSDKVFSLWLKGKYTTDEARLIEDLYLNEIPQLNRLDKKADILFQLAYFKCFNDTSLLTKSECFLMRDYLEIIYKHSLTKD